MATLTTTRNSELTIGLQAGSDPNAALLAWETVTLADLRPMRDETWLAGLRAGVLSADPGASIMTVLPGESVGPQQVRGYTIELRVEAKSFRRHFATASLEQVAQRAAKRLIKQQVLSSKDDFHFFVSERPPADEPQRMSDEQQTSVIVGGSVTEQVDSARAVEVYSEPLEFEHTSLAEYLARSERWVGPMSTVEPLPDGAADVMMPVFVSRQIWQEAHELARRGGELESAALFTGRLARDTDSPELFLLIDDCIVASHASATSHSVLFSGETWKDMQDRLEQRRRRLGQPNELFVGSVHGHNFGPALDETGQKTCTVCDQRAVCSRSTAVISSDDILWHQTVFCSQPWAILLVWGWNARDEEEWRLYGLANGTLSPRSIYIS